MDRISRRKRSLAPNRSRIAYLRQADVIAAAIVVAIGCCIYVFEHGHSMLWLLLAEAALAAVCGMPMLTCITIIGDAISSLDNPLTFILGFVLLIILLPFLAVFFLVAALVQAARAKPADAA